MTGRRLLVLLCAAALAAGACSSDDDPSPSAPAEPAPAEPTAPSTEGTTTETRPEATDAPATTAPPATVPPAAEPPATTPPTTAAPADLRSVLADRGIGQLTLLPTTESGPHPTLSWEAVEDAAAYWLVVLDGSGRAHWAWTGSDTSVRFGGGERADENQTSPLHEPMTWSVSALDAAGLVIALSDVGSLTP